jgi:hypothetical protein
MSFEKLSKVTVRPSLFPLKSWPSVGRVRPSVVEPQFLLPFAEATMEISTHPRFT